MSYPPISPGPRPPQWQPYYQPYPVVMAPPPTSGMAVAALILGLLSVGGGFCLILPPFLAVAFGHMARGDTKRGARGGNGMAVAGLIMGYVCLVPLVLLFAQVVLGLALVDWDSITNPTPSP